MQPCAFVTVYDDSGDYRPFVFGFSEFHKHMTQKVEADLARLLERLKNAQRTLLLTAAKSETLPTDGMLRKISELEGAIAATEALIQEEQADH